MRRNEILWGAILAIVGLALLLGNLFGFDVWDVLWPTLLILLGLWILWGVVRGPTAREVEEAVVSLEGARRAKVHVEYGAGRLLVGGGAPDDLLLEGAFGDGVERRVRREGEALDVRLKPPGSVFLFPWSFTSPQAREWRIAFNEALPLNLNVQTGASEARLDLRELQVTELKVGTGASSVEVTMPAGAGHTQARVESGVASVVVRIPEGVAARVRAKGGLASNNVNTARFPRTGNQLYASPDYETAENRVDLVVETGVGSVEVR